MRNIYIAVISFLVLSLVLFIASFIYLDLTKHKTYHFVVSASGRDIGTIRIDKFVTEDKRIYRSSKYLPFALQFTEYRSRLSLDNRYNLENFTKERIAGRVTDLLYIENFRNAVSFVSRFQSKFAFVDSIPIRKNSFVFEEDSPVTYMPLIENYNFARGRSQGFYTLIPSQSFNMPPRKRFVVLTSIRDEHIKIGSRKIKTENLILKIRDYPQASIWVAKNDRSVIRLEIPSQGLKITRTFKPVTIQAKDYRANPEGYREKEVSFKSKGAELAGTLTLPASEGKFPGALLVWGQGPQGRYYQGLFYSMAGYLAKNGFSVLSFDKRGVGSSTGDPTATTEADLVEDIDAALAYLASRPEVDSKKIVLIGHARGAVYAMKVAATNDAAKGIVLMAPGISASSDPVARKEALKVTAAKARWSDDYASLVTRSIEDTESKAAGTKGNWVYLLGKRCFTAKVREEMADRPMGTIGTIKKPVLILQGGKVDEASAEAASNIDNALAAGGNQSRTMTYYAYLGPFLSETVDDGVHRTHYEADKQVLENIAGWLARTFEEPAIAPESTPDNSPSPEEPKD